MEQSTGLSTGVQELIDRLRSDGVQAGQEEAEQRVSEAKRKAQEIIAQAKSQAEELLADARSQIETDKQAAKNALEMAIRDARLKLASEISARFSARVKQLVERELESKEMLGKLILAVAGRSVPQELKDRKVELLVSQYFSGPGAAVSGGEGEELLKDLITGVCADMLREGIELKPVPGSSKGFRIRASAQDVELDLTEEGIAELLLSHLLPKFREMYQGVGA